MKIWENENMGESKGRSTTILVQLGSQSPYPQIQYSDPVLAFCESLQ